MYSTIGTATLARLADRELILQLGIVLRRHTDARTAQGILDHSIPIQQRTDVPSVNLESPER